MKTMILFVMPDRTLRSVALEELPTYPFEGMKLLAPDKTVYRVSGVLATVGIPPATQLRKLLETVMAPSEVASRGGMITPFSGKPFGGRIFLPTPVVTDVPRTVLVTLEVFATPDEDSIAEAGSDDSSTAEVV